MRICIPTTEAFTQQLQTLSADEIVRMQYVTHLGRVFTTVAIFEQTLIQALFCVKQVRVGRQDASSSSADRAITKLKTLQSYTLGNLISALSAQRADEADISYLKFIQRNRDYFVHRFFREAPWPGEITPSEIGWVLRRLSYLEIIFGRASDRIWKIIARNGYAELVDLGEAGSLVIPPWEDD